jgi:hypothetical protein
MLGNCLIRNPLTMDRKLDAGALCESLLFFSKTHVVLDQATLTLFVTAGFIDHFIELLKRGYVTASYAPETPALYTDNKGGLKEHFFVVIAFGGTQETGLIKRSPDALLFQLERLIGDKRKAKSVHHELCGYLSFKTLDKSNVIKKAADDLADPSFAIEIARMGLDRFGIPTNEIKFSRLNLIPLGEGRFTVDTDIDFHYLRQRYVPSEPQFGVSHLFPGVGDARLDISLAAESNSAFVGNTSDQRIIEMILAKAIGVQSTKDATVPRAIYDFISVDTPSVREVINSGSRSPREFIELLAGADTFKRWLNAQNPDKDLIREMLVEKTKVGWLEKLPAKVARFGIFSAGGFLADLAAPGSSVVLGAVDGFLIDQLSKKWRPHFFVENNLRGFLDVHR